MKKLALLVIVAALATAGLSASAATTAPSASTSATNSATVPVTGTIPSLDGTFTGTFTVTRFIRQDGQIAAVGTLTGTLADATGAVLGTVDQQATFLVDAAQRSCTILDLTLGPLDLNLLGLLVHLDRVHLNITAQPGPGNLLGNLLCSVA